MKHPLTLLAALLLLLAVLSTAAPLEQEQEQELEKARRIVEPAGHMRMKRSWLSSLRQAVWRSNDENRPVITAGLYDRQYHIRDIDIDDDVHIA
jgi:hypothetical protein